MPVWVLAVALFAASPGAPSGPIAMIASGDAALDDALAKAAPKSSVSVVARDAVKHAVREATKLGLKCSADDAACNAKVGVLAGAAAVVVPKVSGATFTLSLVEVSDGKEVATAGPFAKKSDALLALQALLAPNEPALAHPDPTPIADPAPLATTTPTPTATTMTPTPTMTPTMTSTTTTQPTTTTKTTQPTTTTTPIADAQPMKEATHSSLFAPVAIGAGVVAVLAIGCGVGALVQEAALHDKTSTPEQRAPVRALGQDLTYAAAGAGVVAIAAGGVAFVLAGP